MQSSRRQIVGKEGGAYSVCETEKIYERKKPTHLDGNIASNGDRKSFFMFLSAPVTHAWRNDEKRKFSRVR